MSGLAIRIGIVAVIVIGGFVLRDRLSGSAGDLRVGDCFEEPTAAVEIADVQHQPCGDPHDNEVIFVGDNPAPKGAPVLTDEEHEAFVVEHCLPAFLAYTGGDLLTQEVLDIGWYVPTDEAWRDGTRTVICYTTRLDGTQLTGSVKKS